MLLKEAIPQEKLRQIVELLISNYFTLLHIKSRVNEGIFALI